MRRSTGRARILDTLRRLGQFYVSRRAVEGGNEDTWGDSIHVGRVFALLADADIRSILGIAVNSVDR